MTGQTFHESWYRVTDLKLQLRPTVRVYRQKFRGETWFVLHDPFNNQFFRIRPEAHDFVARLGPGQTVEQVWHACLERHPDTAPGQEDVIQLLAQLYYANLLHFEIPADSAKLFERYRKRKQREIQSRLLSIMFIRIPLFDPDNLLRKIIPFFRHLISPIGAVLWFLVVGVAIKLVIDRFDMVADQVQGILSPANLPLLYLGMVVIKTLHEFGHAVVCRRYGGEVHTMGVMLLVFTPLPYMDATSSWAFKSRWQRALVGGAGMSTEVFVAAMAAMIWAYTGPGTIHSLAYNMMFVASVSTVLFNIHPLLRFDGYYILSDLLDIPNLATRAKAQLRHLVEHYAFGYKRSVSPSHSLKEQTWLTVFGILSGLYRILVFVGIILFVADKFLLAGILMALICIFSWGVVPLFRLVKYLASNPRLARTRERAIVICSAFFILTTACLLVLPFPNRFKAPGIVEAVHYNKVVNDAPGYVEEILASSGTFVKEKAPLLQLSDQELDLNLMSVKAQISETRAMQLKALHSATADLEPLKKRQQALQARLKDLQRQKNDLIVRARQAGIWVSPSIQEAVGSWGQRGRVLGEIVDPGHFRFSAVVSQEEAAALFSDQIRKTEVRVSGQGGINLKVDSYRIIPFRQEELPSAALGWSGGGEVPVSVDDRSGTQSAEPFFQIFADLQSNPDVLLLHGRSGKIRFTLNPKPLLIQWGQDFRQLLQKRYRI